MQKPARQPMGDVHGYVKDGRTFLLVRTVREALELDVEWDQETIAITALYQSARLLAIANVQMIAPNGWKNM